LVISGAEVVEVPKEIKAKLDDLEKIVEEAKRRVGSDMADYFASPTSRDDERMGNIIQGHECGGKVDLGFRKKYSYWVEWDRNSDKYRVYIKKGWKVMWDFTDREGK